MNSSVVFCQYELEHPLMNAAGTCKTLEDVARFARSSVSAIVVGSITWESRFGNEGNVYWRGQQYSLNSLGMPNRGRVYYDEMLPKMAELAHAASKPLIVSVAGFSPAEYVLLAQLAFDGGANIVELNLGCPNVYESGQQHGIAAFDGAGISEIVHAVQKRVPTSGRHQIGVKLSPYSDPGKLTEIARVVASLSISYVATSNTFPNALVLDEKGKPVIEVGLAGMSGAAMKPVGLGQVRQFSQLLPESIQLVGVGGIMTGQDIVDYQRAGATTVQAATAYWNRNEDVGTYADILQDYANHFPKEEAK